MDPAKEKRPYLKLVKDGEKTELVLINFQFSCWIIERGEKETEKVTDEEKRSENEEIWNGDPEFSESGWVLLT